MAARAGMIEEFSFAAEGLTGTAASAALRRVRSLADSAPPGRLFNSIATLTEMSRRIETSLEAGSAAMAAGDEDSASLELARAVVGMDRLAGAAMREDAVAAPLPNYLKRSR
ncbi:MAG: hypothetical protein HC855_14605 [Rhizobiales bacterium]|nr:hypothetical protein [Hyphomicrobiales bacterium]